jgi:uncharacterized protein with HEPN domain
MPPDQVRLRHILDACSSIATFVQGRNRADLDGDQQLAFALMRAVEIIGEAASGVSSATQAAMPAVPWSQIRGMRNRLIHAYFDVDHDILWRTATVDVPALAATLRPVVEITNEAEQ